jgi:hypothetical protein
MSLATSAAMVLTAISAVFCVLSAFFAWRALTAASRLRSMISMQGELAEIRDYMAKIDRWAKRINARDVMQENRDPETGKRTASQRGSSISVSGIHDKDELRRRAGLVAGQSPRHRSDA